ncbi:hypothetical protein CXB51_005629 [Gossypium anomalum]|uniref:Membrane-associated 30 kDa protein n=1 Tax=Gossypium anomalum TaxID=47600 RepID=A0A8J5ZMQ7_9ROSI|nr:hypothetical protein CXB51_005629 [Gossypium anomalum]
MAANSQIFTGLTLPFKPIASSSSSSSSSSNSTCIRCLVKKSLTSSFFNGGVAALKITSIRTLPGGSHSCRGGAGAIGTRMNLFDRFARVVKSYANALLSSVEDPEKILEQAVIEMNDDLVKMRQATAQVLASQKRLENKYKAAQQASEDWYRKAQLALQKGEEDLAREALKRRKSYADNASSLKAQLDQQKSVVENLVSNTRLLESKIQEAKSKKDTLKARAQTARTATKVNEMVGNVNTSNALSAFEKMEEKGELILGWKVFVISEHPVYSCIIFSKDFEFGMMESAQNKALLALRYFSSKIELKHENVIQSNYWVISSPAFSQYLRFKFRKLRCEDASSDAKGCEEL